MQIGLKVLCLFFHYFFLYYLLVTTAQCIYYLCSLGSYLISVLLKWVIIRQKSV